MSQRVSRVRTEGGKEHSRGRRGERRGERASESEGPLESSAACAS